MSSTAAVALVPLAHAVRGGAAAAALVRRGLRGHTSSRFLRHPFGMFSQGLEPVWVIQFQSCAVKLYRLKFRTLRSLPFTLSPISEKIENDYVSQYEARTKLVSILQR
eukprot:6196124-Pleurochrysis_carterae.AAC.1